MNEGGMGEKIKKYRKEKGLSQNELADALGISYMTVRRWEAGKRTPSSKMIIPLCKVLGISNLKLFFGEGITPASLVKQADDQEDNPSQTKQSDVISNLRPIRGDVVEVPVLGPQSSVCCGKGFDINDVDTEILRYELVPEEWELGPRGDYPLYITYVEGDSMEPLLEDGGRILVNPNEEVTHGKVAVVAWNGYSMVRGVAFERNGDIRLRARNPSYPEIIIKANDAEYVLKWCGVVKRFLGRDRAVTGFF